MTHAALKSSWIIVEYQLNKTYTKYCYCIYCMYYYCSCFVIIVKKCKKMLKSWTYYFFSLFVACWKFLYVCWLYTWNPKSTYMSKVCEQSLMLAWERLIRKLVPVVWRLWHLIHGWTTNSEGLFCPEKDLEEEEWEIKMLHKLHFLNQIQLV